MGKYTTAISEAKWMENGGWCYENIFETKESDELRNSEYTHDEWRTILWPDFLDNEGILRDVRSRPGTEYKYTVKVYLTEDYKSAPDEASPLFEDFMWESIWLEDEFNIGFEQLIADKEDEKQ